MPTTRTRRTRTTSRQSAPVVLSTALGSSVDVRSDNLYAISRRWRYVMNNRRRATESVVNQLRKESAANLATIGVDVEALKRLAGADTIEVAIRFDEKDDSWAARIVPWEQLLSMATWPYRTGPLTVVRRLVLEKRDAKLPLPPRHLLLVNSAPGPLASTYADEFASECRFVRHLLAPALKDEPEEEQDPSRPELQAVIAKQKPDVIHIACVDTYAGWNLVPQQRPEEPFDGIFLRDSASGVEAVSAETLRGVISADGHVQPLLVSLSTCYSAARIAPLAVAGGARAAIGFNGLVDGVLAERFFATFYSSWIETGWNIIEAFRRARVEVSSHRLTQQGGAVVLWSDVSLLGEPHVARRAAAATRTPRAGAAAAKARPKAEPPTLDVDCRPLPQLNYSLLHNRRSLFEVFTIKNLGGGEATGVKVFVQLHVGESSFPWQRTLDVKQSKPVDLSDEVQVPLVAGILREAREGIRTSLLVEVTLNGQVVSSNTFSVTLLSADEWRDDPKEWRWLPCFVLPRDAAVQKVLDAAQPYLRSLTDDSTCGFDGYQRLVSVGPQTDYSVVDTQVRAIWSALVHDLPLGYINPPPTYAAASQRIRTPSQVLNDHRGTCIDLALLLAACLEYIGLYPVLFLTQGHAFTGYWRSPEAHDAWMNFREPTTTDAPLRADETLAERRDSEPWMVGQGDAFAEVLQFVQDTTLVPLEATALTRLGPFAEACETGIKNLNDPWSFDAMIDLYRARRENVTPLPLHTIAEAQS